MTQREATLLLGLVNEYIRTGQPVASATLVQTVHLNKSPATIRADLHELEQHGYVYQPHTSAGRVPTDAGYRFYVDHVRAGRVAAEEQTRLQAEFIRLLEAHQQLARITARFLAHITATPAVSSQSDPPDVFESGLRELVQHTDKATAEELHEVTSLLEKLDQHLTVQPRPTVSEEARVYIGEEIPMMPARHSSLVVRSVTLTDGQAMTLVILGPKRMPYQRNIALLNAVAAIIQHYDPLE